MAISLTRPHTVRRVALVAADLIVAMLLIVAIAVVPWERSWLTERFLPPERAFFR